MTYKGVFCYIEVKTKAKRRGKQLAGSISGHYEVIDEDDKFILLREDELEIPIAKKDIVKFELKEKPNN